MPAPTATGGHRFDGDGGTRTLKCNQVTFEGGITVTWTSDAIITDDD